MGPRDTAEPPGSARGVQTHAAPDHGLSTRAATRLAAAMWVATLTLAAAGAYFTFRLPAAEQREAIGQGQFAWFFVVATFATVGGLLSARRPGNPVAWLLGAGGLILAIDGDYAWYYATPAADHVFATTAVALAANLLWLPTISIVVFWIPMLFPDGHLLSPRWRFLCRVLVAAIVVGSLTGGLLDPAAIAPLHNPIGIPGTQTLMEAVASACNLVASACIVGAIGSLVLRYRRSDSEQRHQLKWFASIATVMGVTFLLGTAFPNVQPASLALALSVAPILAAALLPVTIAIAVLKYRLYDIDVLISRTLVYGALAALITGVYVGIAVGLGALVGGGGKPNLWLSILATAIVAVGFQPVREQMQRIANRIVYGKRATPYEVLSQFSERVAESYASEEVLPRMARVLAEGTSADSSQVWLRSGGQLRRAATYPFDGEFPGPIVFDASTVPAIAPADRVVEVRHQGEVLGALSVTKRRGESLTPIELKLMDDLAHQAGLVLKNVGLTADLQGRLDDLRASRQRLVAAQDGERRRLERNLHDGAQQSLVAIKVKLGLAEMLMARDPEKAAATVAALKHDADDALETLRDLARGIYPPLLAEKGLAVALRSQALKASLPVEVDADGIGRYPQETEAALYFCTLEALQNAQKYAAPTLITVRLRDDGTELLVEVRDDGRGFDTARVTKGAGLTNMEDRLDALGGTVEIESAPGAGTALRAVVPAHRLAAVSG